MFLCAFWDRIPYAWGAFNFLTEIFLSSAFYLSFQFVPLMTRKIKPALETTTQTLSARNLMGRLRVESKDHTDKNFPVFLHCTQ